MKVFLSNRTEADFQAWRAIKRLGQPKDIASSGLPLADRGWKRPFDDPIPLPRGRELVTLEDAGTYITHDRRCSRPPDGHRAKCQTPPGRVRGDCDRGVPRASLPNQLRLRPRHSLSGPNNGDSGNQP
jgi:hypothetical protein